MKMRTISKVSLVCLTLLLTSIMADSQNYFRSGMFLHHSTGNNIWENPDGTATTSIPAEMTKYNTTHGYSGGNAVSMEENWWAPPDENNWWLVRKFYEGDTAFSNGIASQFDFNYCLSHYKIIVVKSCYPSSWVYFWGEPSDTLDEQLRSVYNYKWHWRKIVKVMRAHPDHFFVIWTNAPLAAANTNAEEAHLSWLFSTWAKDTLAAGLDPATGAFPSNAYVFDYFRKVADANGYLPVQYTIPGDDFHPNGTVTSLVAPQFVNEIFDHAIAYEHSLGISSPTARQSLQISPNPATDKVFISLPADDIYRISIFDGAGKPLVSTNITGGIAAQVDISGLPAGYYLVKALSARNGIMTSAKLIVLEK